VRARTDHDRVNAYRRTQGLPAQLEAECDAAMAAGRVKYGEFDAATEQRDLLGELRAELRDAINYACMLHVMGKGVPSILRAIISIARVTL
jgi:hypothetical protein